MPSTCDSNKQTVSHKEFVPKKHKHTEQRRVCDGILQVCTDTNASVMLEYIEASIVYISDTFFDSRMSTQLTQLRNTARSCVHSTRVAIFFLLLNVDIELKRKIYDLEIQGNHKKITRFLTDLRESIVTEYLVSEEQSILDFVDACQQGYIIS